MKKSNDPRHNARRIALQTLFKWSYNPENDVLLTLEEVLRELEGTEGFNPNFNRQLAQELLKGTTSKIQEIDKIITKTAPQWPLDQIARVDLNILRLAIFEVIFYNLTPPKVAIDEAVELAKEFGGENSPKFINGVLGTVMEMKEKTVQLSL